MMTQCAGITHCARPCQGSRVCPRGRGQAGSASAHQHRFSGLARLLDMPPLATRGRHGAAGPTCPGLRAWSRLLPISVSRFSSGGCAPTARELGRNLLGAAGLQRCGVRWTAPSKMIQSCGLSSHCDLAALPPSSEGDCVPLLRAPHHLPPALGMLTLGNTGRLL